MHIHPELFRGLGLLEDMTRMTLVCISMDQGPVSRPAREVRDLVRNSDEFKYDPGYAGLVR
jgi:hypothetical protein